MSTLIDNPVLLLFLVIGVSAALGGINVRGVSLGPAAALFVGLAVSAADERLANTPAVVGQIGLALFIYTVGLASGPSFLDQVRNGGGRVLLAAGVVLVAAAGLVVAAGSVLDLDRGARAGLFAGTLTNTPALSAALDSLTAEIASGELTDPVVGYSLAYPFGVLSMLLAAHLVLRSRRARVARATTDAAATAPTTSATVAVSRVGLPPLGELRRWQGSALGFSRVEHAGTVQVATNDVVLQPGDLAVVIGATRDVAAFIEWAGERSDRHLPLDRSTLDFRRISVSNRSLAGTRLADLDLEGRFGATVARVRRGDTDRVADGDLVLRLGDRLRVVAPSHRLPEVATLLGDSDRSLAEVDPRGFALGMAAGLLLGLVAVPLPGGGEVELGIGGGSLVAGLVLGVISRTRGVTWQVPHAANLTLRQLGLLIFLASVGIRSGAAFADAVGTATGAKLAAAAVVVALLVAAMSMLATRVLRADAAHAAGYIAGIETQPAVQAFAAEVTHGDERVDAGYALVLPLAMILKLVLVQLLV